MSVEQERRGRVTLKPRQIRRIIALVSGGDFAGAGAALKELRVAGNRWGLDVHYVRHGFLGLANNWIEAVTEHDTRGMSSIASSPIGSSRFEDSRTRRSSRMTKSLPRHPAILANANHAANKILYVAAAWAIAAQIPLEDEQEYQQV